MSNNKVVVAMSGGVDSSVAAYLLKKQGYETIGVFLRFWSPDDKKDSLCNFENSCCSGEARDIAERTARKLNIPFYVLDARDFFKEKVVDYFIKEYSIGKTPNPCVMCGKYVKFSFLHNKARQLFDAAFVATGHYISIKKTKNGFSLLKGKDSKKDQSYFLYTANQKSLDGFLFPLGDLEKKEVRRIAKDAMLPSYSRPESQEICFVPENNYSDFLIKHSEKSFKKGWIVDSSGVKIKEHNGIQNFTIGQRKGLGFSSDRPLYVIRINSKKNEVVIGRESDLYSKEMLIGKVNWISGFAPKEGTVLDIKVRYSMVPVKGRLYKNKVIFHKPVRAVTPGQSVVFYKGRELLGGGIIK